MSNMESSKLVDCVTWGQFNTCYRPELALSLTLSYAASPKLLSISVRMGTCVINLQQLDCQCGIFQSSRRATIQVEFNNISKKNLNSHKPTSDCNFLLINLFAIFICNQSKCEKKLCFEPKHHSTTLEVFGQRALRPLGFVVALVVKQWTPLRKSSSLSLGGPSFCYLQRAALFLIEKVRVD